MNTKLCSLFLFLLALSTPVSAHLAGGQDVSVDGYIVDLGHTPATITAGDPTTFLFTLANKSQVNADSVWVRIADETTQFTGTLKTNTFGSATMTQTLPRTGSYNVKTRFKKDNDVIVEHTFTINSTTETTYLPMFL